MSREKSIFEHNILIGEEATEAVRNTFSGKYEDLWKKYLKENQSDRYYHMVRA